MSPREVRCEKCGTASEMNDRTIYLKCRSCGTVLYKEHDADVSDRLVVVDYGRTGDSRWVKVCDTKTKQCYTYWREG